jgi:hypothetical protein
MSTKLKSRAFALAVLGLAMGGATGAHAQSANVSGRLLLTGGVSQVEGAAGGAYQHGPSLAAMARKTKLVARAFIPK